MLYNYFVLGFRNLVKHKSFTIISLFGLITGISSALVLILYAYQELTFDRVHTNRENIYHVYKDRVTPNGSVTTYDTWVPLLPALKEQYPAIEDGARVLRYIGLVSVGDKNFSEDVMFVDPSVFKLFSLTVEHGDGSEILGRKSDIIISKETAVKYFGQADAVGKSVHARLGGVEYDFTIGGVLEDVPVNSTIRPTVMIPWENAMSIAEVRTADWGGAFLATYIMVSNKGQVDQLISQFPALVDQKFEEGTSKRMSLHLLSLADYHSTITGSHRSAYIMISIAFIILLIAVVNYVNLATVRSVERAKEIGLRKVLGASRLGLVRQFLGESVFLTTLAVIASLAILQAAMSFINSALSISLSLDVLAEPMLLMPLIVLFVSIGILSGSFPAFFISGIRTVESIRGKMKTSSSGLILKRVLIVVQFGLSVVLLFSTIVIYRQVNFLRDHELGFDKENVLVIPTDADNMRDAETARQRIASVKKELLQQSQVVAVASSQVVPSDISTASYTLTRPDGWTDENPFRIMRVMVDDAYFPLYNIEFLEGSNFHDHLAPLDTAVRNFAIINESAMKAFGWTSIEGKKVGLRTQVVGLVKDHHYTHLGSKVEPVFFVYRPTEEQANYFVSVRFRGNAADMIKFAEQKWRELDPSLPFSWFFVDSNFDQLYKAEDRNIRIITWFSVGAIVIACVGLLGLIGFTISQKQKEIGIRKVLGASDTGIVVLLNREFMLLIVISVAIALPLASFLMQRWLSGFALQTTIHWTIYFWVVAATIFLALATTSIRILRAANVNPVDSLRIE
jgi:putative ABC transport system permease protein